MNRAFIAAVVFVLLTAHAWCQTRSVLVSGIVRDSAGRLEAGAFVTAFPISESAVAGTLSWSRGDDQGRFQVVVEPGKYIIRAKHEEAGSADPNALLSRDARNHFPVITAGKSDITDVEVILAPRGGVLEGVVVDGRTHIPITGGQVIIRDARNPRAIVELTTDFSGRFQFTLPNRPVLISASAPGYSAIHFQDGRELTLSGGEHRRISIALARAVP